MKLRSIKSMLGVISATPLHPQWLMGGDKQRFLSAHAAALRGRVLDIGCAGKEAKGFLGEGVQYLGLDDYLASIPYGTMPDIYAGAGNLPFADESIDHVLLLDVLEHVPDADMCIREIQRVMKPGGKLLLNIPFIYPVHDAPDDYRRLTEFGLLKLLEKVGMKIELESAHGHPLVTSALMLNLALCRTVITSWQERHPAVFLIVLLPVLIPLINLLGYLAGLLFPADRFMPYRYHVVASKAIS